ncbi:lysophospholipase [Rhodococcus spelaei]|uniref:Lysophospholipase n=1 Tax=Rhodococcus spelaei TaxID=2546320 RepID=A0A541AZT9_9NOCA|nr:alpha/beta fold hydrolase [Rhodococcus spelaei]TQF65588.1 lysophospholipase [Rhodococcus spelaei]
MPFFEGASGQVHYRHWPCSDPVVGMVFLHGLGQHSGHYHRFARMLAERRVELWALDHVGHGLSEGELGEYGPLGDLGENALRLADIAAADSPGLDLVVMGHSLGAAATVAALTADPNRFVAAVLCGIPRQTADDPGALDEVRVPILAVHGVDDRRAPVDGAREFVDRVSGAQLHEYPDAGHDLLHEPVQRRVVDDVAEFVVRTSVAG